MKNRWAGISIGLALCLLGSSSAAQNIRFRKGQDSIVLRGKFVDTNKTYSFRARRGQKAKVSLVSAKGKAGSLSFTLYSYCGEEYGTPLVDHAKNWSGKLPCTDNYTLDVHRQKNINSAKPLNENYTLKIQIR